MKIAQFVFLIWYSMLCVFTLIAIQALQGVSL